MPTRPKGILPTPVPRTPKRQQLTVAGLFAGIGGIELGLHRAGHESSLLCEIDPGAARVLEHRFPKVSLKRDVRELKNLGDADLVVGGFPCQDLSQAGRTAGIKGKNSGLVGHVFRLLDAQRRGPKWLMLENVSFMLQLDRGRGMRFLVDELEERGFAWAYRVVDTRAFGLPQRRKRVILLASKTEDPRAVLFADDAMPVEAEQEKDTWCGFYWTEGARGLGWAVDAVPTLKGGSTVGIPSPPAVWIPDSGKIATPEIRDVERLQGFDADWTLPALEVEGVRRGHRWKLVGNAVSVPVAEWIGRQLAAPGAFDEARNGDIIRPGVSWPKAAHGRRGVPSVGVNVSLWPVSSPREHLSNFIKYDMAPLSFRAAAGFKGRLDQSSLRYSREFGAAIEAYVKRAKREARIA